MAVTKEQAEKIMIGYCGWAVASKYVDQLQNAINSVLGESDLLSDDERCAFDNVFASVTGFAGSVRLARAALERIAPKPKTETVDDVIDEMCRQSDSCIAVYGKRLRAAHNK